MAKDITSEQNEILCDLINAFRALRSLGLKVVAVDGRLFAMNDDVDVTGLSSHDVDRHDKTCCLGCELSAASAPEDPNSYHIFKSTENDPETCKVCGGNFRRIQHVKQK